MRTNVALLSVVLFGSTTVLGGAGCSSSSDTQVQNGNATDAGTVDAAPADAGAADAGPSLPIPDGRRLVKLAGPILPSPVIVPLFWGDDPDRARTETLLGKIPGSDWWKLLGEYGVGDVTVAPSVTIADVSPATYSLNDIETTIATVADGTHGPAPSGKEIYAIYLPQKMSVLNTDGSAFCGGMGDAYHESTQGRAPDFAYAVTPHCSANFGEFSVAATHELIEAATDPYPLVTPAWAATDPGHVGWRGEIGDLCDYGGSMTALGATELGERVERIFSNAAAAKGGDPCVPSLGLPYFDAAPVPTDDVTVPDVLLGPQKGRGVKLAIGETKTVPVVLYADRAVPPWQVTVETLALSTYRPSTSIDVTIDKTQGSAGDVLELTIARNGHADDYGDVVFLYSSDSKEFWSDTISVSE